VVELVFDFSGRIESKDEHFALFRGPLLLTRDIRFGDGVVDQPVKMPPLDKPVVVTPAESGIALPRSWHFCPIEKERPPGRTVSHLAADPPEMKERRRIAASTAAFNATLLTLRIRADYPCI